MERKTRSKRRFLLLALSFVLAGGLVLVVLQPAIRKARLEAACDGADRVVIVVNALPRHARTIDDAAHLPSVEIVGADKVRSLLDSITFKWSCPGMSCRCFGERVFFFARGQETLATASYHHGTHLRSRDGRWLGDASLTWASREALAAWLNTHAPALAAAAAAEPTATQPADEPTLRAPR